MSGMSDINLLVSLNWLHIASKESRRYVGSTFTFGGLRDRYAEALSPPYPGDFQTREHARARPILNGKYSLVYTILSATRRRMTLQKR